MDCTEAPSVFISRYIFMCIYLSQACDCICMYIEMCLWKRIYVCMEVEPCTCMRVYTSLYTRSFPSVRGLCSFLPFSLLLLSYPHFCDEEEFRRNPPVGFVLSLLREESVTMVEKKRRESEEKDKGLLPFFLVFFL